MMDNEQRLKLKSLATGEKPLLNVGKKGLEDPVIDEIKKQLKARRLVKIKVLRSAEGDSDVKSIAEELSQRTSSELIDVRGRSVVLYR